MALQKLLRRASKGICIACSGKEKSRMRLHPGFLAVLVSSDRHLHRPTKREGAFVGEPQVPTTFERSASAAETPLQRPAKPVCDRRSRGVCGGTAPAGSNSLANPAVPYPLAKGWQRSDRLSEEATLRQIKKAPGWVPFYLERVVSLDWLGRKPLIWAKKKSLNAICVQTQSGGGDGGIRTHVPISRQNDFESFSLRPLRYVSKFCLIIISESQGKVKASAGFSGRKSPAKAAVSLLYGRPRRYNGGKNTGKGRDA